ncbi:RHS repeat-associated core domain-containing protein [Ohtaekwangia koreensis]|uniref:RHS repeat-associated core domain-containing protein n=2 Tax=Ohtaekwangia koreensis TaxID=688867 RepID=A0A1T5MA44_9BACT|nr:RHS repeat-associated core domain-containing protein [Ohtaekwangia koreensis]
MRSTLLTFLSSILLICVLNFTVQATTTAPVDVVPDAVEFAALKAIYDNLGGSGWTTKTNWPASGSWPSSATSAQFGTWYGVTVTNGDISKIVLPSNKLTGTIPSEIGSLQAMNTLNMYNNLGITGSIPTSIGQVSALQFIYLYTCNLTGTIPSSLFDIAGLQYVALANNKLSGSIPSNVGNATGLTYLGLHANDLTGTIPSSICNLVNLTGLYLYENELTGSIPTNIGNLSKLVNLYLYTNKLTGDIPSSLGNITTLVDLKLSTNQLTGTIPSSIKNLINLQTLTLHTNKLSGSIPSEIGNLTKLVNLYLYSNQLTGTIPSSIGNLVNLVYFQIHYNKLSGSLPSSLTNLTKVKYFYISDNQLTGNIPAGFSALNQMITFYVYNNKFSGELPATVFSGWNKVTAINISNNQFSGAFPSSISTCVALASINALKNQFTSLPSGLLSLPVFNSTNFSYNELTSIPDFTTHINKANLYLNISYNRLDFGTLQPLVGAGLRSVVLTPQKNIQDVLFVTPVVGASLAIAGRAAGSNGTIIWEKQKGGGDWESVNAQNENSTPQNYTRNTFAAIDEGIYRIRMTNTSFAGVTIVSEPIKVKTAINLAIDNWGFQYKYDGRRRMTHKKVPGADWVYMVYDERDRLVMTQDGEQRKSNKWMVTKYDALNRPIITGIYTHATAVDQAGMASQISTTAFSETFNGTTAFHGYTNTVFPFDLTKFDALTVTYYDSYDFRSLLNDDRYNYKSDELTEQYKSDAAGNSFSGVIGQVTGIKTKVLDYYGTGGVTTWLSSINYYDDKYRVVQTVADNFQGGKDRITNIYDFTGKVLKSRTSHYGLSWKGLLAARHSANRIEKTSTANAWGTSGGISVEVLPAGQDGWFEFIAPSVKGMVIELANTAGTIKYGLFLTTSPQVQVIENGGSNLLVPSPVFAAGDFFRVERKQGKIKFYRNGKFLIDRTATSDPLVVRFSIYSAGGVLYNVRSSFGSYSPQTVTRTFDYDHAGRLRKVWHQVNDGDRILLAQNEYNELGQIITKKLHSENQGGTFKQHVDMRYNIRGWLTRINNTDLAADASGDPRDHFGMNLAYNEPVSTLNNAPQYNGNISAMTWSNSQGYDDVKANAYKYSYDAMNRISGADFRQKQSSAWDLPQHKDTNGNTLTSDAFSETGYDYDLNGNLQHLTRKSTKGTSLDVLTYDYGTGAAKSNKLLSVSDASDIRQGFTDGNIGSEDYTYDANGSMNVDKNKDITAITYNHLNLPVQVTKVSGEYIKYFYDATGRKLCQQVFNSSSAPTKQTDYAGEYFYENDTLKFINHDEGRIVMTGASPEYQYHLKDHLGNVRVTFTTKVEVDNPVATMETANEETEGKEFLYYDEAVKVDFKLFDHTNQGPTYYSTRLNGTANERTGLAKSLSVMPGDVIKAEVYAKYLDTNKSNWSTAVTNLITSIANGTAATTTYVDGGAIGSTGGTVNPFGSILNKGNETGTAPKAYLNYLVFDRDYNILDGGFVRVSEAAMESGTGIQHEHELLSKELVIKKPGYVYLYLSNDNVALGGSPVEVYFDDFMVEHTKSPVIQSDEYYPFGLTFNSYRRENSVFNKIKFQGQEHIDDLNLGWDSFKWRNHQPDIGRFFNVDPLSEKYVYNSVYAFSENKVTSHRELEGLEATPFNDPAFDAALIEEPADEGPSLNSLLDAGASAWNTIVGFFFGDGNDGTLQSASGLGKAIESVPAIVAGSQEIKGKLEEITAPVPGLNSALNVMDAGQAETTGETMKHLGRAAVNANSIPIVGVRPGAPSLKQQALEIKTNLNGGKNSITIGTVNKQIRFDLAGRTHGNVETPHKQVYNKNMVNGQVKSITRESKNAYPLTQQDIRAIRKFIESLPLPKK